MKLIGAKIADSNNVIKINLYIEKFKYKLI